MCLWSIIVLMQTHKKLREVLYSIIAVCVIVWAIVYVQMKDVDSIPTIPQQSSEIFSENLSGVSTVGEKKSIILEKVVSSTTALSPSEKTILFNEIAGSKAVQYHFSPQEKQAIVKALNTK